MFESFQCGAARIIAKLTVQNNRLTAYLFGSRAERYTVDPEGMTLLFNEHEAILESPVKPKPSKPSCTSDRVLKPRGKRKPLPADLPRVKKTVDLAVNQKLCETHGVELVKIGETRTEKLDIEPAKAFVTDYVVSRYKCPCCEDLNVIHANLPDEPISKSVASSGLLAYIATQKYVDGLPLSRQVRIFERASIDLNRTTLARWMIKAANLASPLISLLHEDLIESNVIHADETHVQVLNEPNKSPESKSYMWCLARSGESPIILYKYYDNRSKNAASELLHGFQGTLVADAYKVYDSLQKSMDFKLAGCFAHARRRFWEAEKFAKKASSRTSASLAASALTYIRQLYAIEESIRELSADEILRVRQKSSLPILDKFFDWLIVQKNQVLPNSPTGKAIGYAISNWSKLIEFSLDGHVPIDNNFMERHIRPFTIGRKAWLFSSTQAGADASATLYSLVESAKANRIEPFDYLKLIFKELPSVENLIDLEKLLPYNAARHFPLRPYIPSKK
ncbi:MAG: IS66 family transposase [Proteobacteria bacterium]|nr:MAG: IS66 family transposase [Pseudomonadota bacterium]